MLLAGEPLGFLPAAVGHDELGDVVGVGGRGEQVKPCALWNVEPHGGRVLALGLAGLEAGVGKEGHIEA